MALYSNIGTLVKDPLGFDNMPVDTYPYAPPIYYDPYYVPPPPIQTTEQVDIVIPPTITDDPAISIAGLIFDRKTNSPVSNATIQLAEMLTGKLIGNALTLPDNSYSAWTEQGGNVYGVKFSAPGYKSVILTFTQLSQNPTVYLDKSAIPIWIFGIVIAAVALIRKKTGKQGKMGAIEANTIVLIAGGLIGFSIVQKVLEELGIWDSKDTKELDSEAVDPTSYWNPNYWQTIKPAGKDWTYAITQATARDYALQIVYAFGPFNDCETCVKSIFHKLRTKANVSFLAWVFQQDFGIDLLSYLRGGTWPEDRLSDDDVSELNQWISKLPNY